MLTLTKSFNDEGEIEEAKEEHVEFLEASEGFAGPLEATEQPLDLVSLLLEDLIVVPEPDTIGPERNHRALPRDREKAMAVRASTATI
jgi:hypothetical protein